MSAEVQKMLVDDGNKRKLNVFVKIEIEEHHESLQQEVHPQERRDEYTSVCVKRENDDGLGKLEFVPVKEEPVERREEVEEGHGGSDWEQRRVKTEIELGPEGLQLPHTLGESEKAATPAPGAETVEPLSRNSKRPRKQIESDQTALFDATEFDSFCTTCGEYFEHIHDFLEHGRSHSENDLYSCDLCDEQFPQRTALRDHRGTHTAGTCAVCLLQFDNKTILKHHILNVHTLEMFPCESCNKKFASQQILATHKRAVHMSSFTCKICKKRFISRQYLTEHQKIHTENLHNCKVCRQLFSSDEYLKDHQRVHVRGSPYLCGICKKQFTRKDHLTRHGLTHTDDNPFLCEVCDKRFKTMTCLTQHQAVHTGKKRFTCDICNKQFGRKTSYELHKPLHSGEKPFSCDTCNKRYSRKSSLHLHKLAHSEEQRYTCEVCHKDFSRKDTYVNHKTVHTREKKFWCKFCPKHYVQKRGLVAHVRGKHQAQSGYETVQNVHKDTT